jgi:hypothetical protein
MKKLNYRFYLSIPSCSACATYWLDSVFPLRARVFIRKSHHQMNVHPLDATSEGLRKSPTMIVNVLTVLHNSSEEHKGIPSRLIQQQVRSLPL